MDEEGVNGQFTDTLYPPPPSVYTRFTRRNLALLEDLRDRIADDLRTTSGAQDDSRQTLLERAQSEWLQLEPPARVEKQNELLKRVKAERGFAASTDAHDMSVDGDKAADEADEDFKETLPDFDLQLELQPPRLDWIEQDGAYFCYSDRWPLQERLLPLSAHPGMVQLYPDGSIDRKATLQTLLRTLLAAYFQLITVLQSPPRDYIATVEDPHAPPGVPPMQVWKSEAGDLSAFIRTTTINMQHLLNEMRPQQAVDGLCHLMKEQLARRRQESLGIQRKCADIRASIATLRGALDARESTAEQ